MRRRPRQLNDDRARTRVPVQRLNRRPLGGVNVTYQTEVACVTCRAGCRNRLAGPRRQSSMNAARHEPRRAMGRRRGKVRDVGGSQRCGARQRHVTCGTHRVGCGEVRALDTTLGERAVHVHATAAGRDVTVTTPERLRPAWCRARHQGHEVVHELEIARMRGGGRLPGNPRHRLTVMTGRTTHRVRPEPRVRVLGTGVTRLAAGEDARVARMIEARRALRGGGAREQQAAECRNGPGPPNHGGVRADRPPGSIWMDGGSPRRSAASPNAMTTRMLARH